MKKILIVLGVFVILIGAGVSSGFLGVNWSEIGQRIQQAEEILPESPQKVKIISEESVVIDIVEKLTPSVVTVGVERERRVLDFDPFDPFGFFNNPKSQGRTEIEEADIGSGFIVSKDGLVVTNKHVVSGGGKYKVITSDNKTYEVKNIYRDPANDIAILKIDASSLQPVEMGDSDQIKVGQLVVAMGTPLGEFRGTVTKGIISGIGRGITAGSPFEGYIEELDNVIQTDAAINPGNSGGPLINSAGQVIGINTAVASGAENIGFALPINLVKEALENFEKTGSFDRAYLDVSYQMISREISIVNDIPEGAYVREVLEGTSAEKAGIARGDIITHFDNQRVKDDEKNNLAKLISGKRAGDRVIIKIWRDGEEKELTVALGEYSGN